MRFKYEAIYSTTFLYIRSVLRVSFSPPITSAPEWSRFRCWKIKTLPTLGMTSKDRRSSSEWNVVAPPSSLPSLESGDDSLR